MGCIEDWGLILLQLRSRDWSGISGLTGGWWETRIERRVRVKLKMKGTKGNEKRAPCTPAPTGAPIKNTKKKIKNTA